MNFILIINSSASLPPVRLLSFEDTLFNFAFYCEFNETEREKRKSERESDTAHNASPCIPLAMPIGTVVIVICVYCLGCGTGAN